MRKRHWRNGKKSHFLLQTLEALSEFLGRMERASENNKNKEQLEISSLYHKNLPRESSKFIIWKAIQLQAAV